jgi:hypothetical protein
MEIAPLMERIEGFVENDASLVRGGFTRSLQTASGNSGACT